MDNDHFLSPKEVAERLGLHPNTVYRAIAKKQLRAHKIGKTLRVSPESLDTWLTECVI
jgi:excisionase family DNA binding protein